jgi:hypothetical protein
MKEHSKKSRGKIQYSSLPFVMKPMPHGDELPVSRLPSNWEDFTFSQKELQEGPSTSCDPSYVLRGDQEPHLINKAI